MIRHHDYSIQSIEIRWIIITEYILNNSYGMITTLNRPPMSTIEPGTLWTGEMVEMYGVAELVAYKFISVNLKV